MKRYWSAKKNKKEISEKEIPWDNNDSANYTEVTLEATDIKDNKGNHLKITVPDGLDVIQGKKATASFDKIDITDRFLGFKIGNNIIKVCLSENKPEIKITVE